MAGKTLPGGNLGHLKAGQRLFICPAYLSGQYSSYAERESRVIVEIVILAMIALFLGMRLYSVLGRRPEGTDDAPRPRSEPSDLALNRAGTLEQPAAPARSGPVALPARVLASNAEHGIRAISAADRQFEPALFLEGAKAAYGMVLNAFWKGDKEELGHLCDRDVYEHFAMAIDERIEAGETVENRLVRIEEAVIT